MAAFWCFNCYRTDHYGYIVAFKCSPLGYAGERCQCLCKHRKL